MLATVARAVAVAMSFGIMLPGLAAAADHGMKYDRKADFSGYETYDWMERKQRPEGSPMAVGGAVDTRIRNAIDRQLAARGFRPAIEEEPDFLVSFDGSLKEVTDIQANRRRIAPGVSWVVDGDINSYREGTLIIAIRDAGTGKSVWSAWTEDKIKNPDHPGKQIDKTVKKLLSKFPPAR